MMKTLIAIFAATLTIVGLYAPNADAARIGGGRSVGIQRSVTPPPRPAAPAQQATPQQSAPAAAAPTPAPQGNRWLGPLAGIAAGLGLAWMFSQGGFSAMGGVVLAVLGVMALFALLRLYSRQQSATANAGPMNYTPLGSSGPQPVATGAGWGGLGAAQPSPSAIHQPNVPPGFDAAGFTKQAKLNFLRLQEANDRGDLAMIQDICVDELATTLCEDIRARQGATQHTEVLGLEANLIEVVTEGSDHFASIAFSGNTIEEPGAPAKPFQEIWHLRKPVSGDAGWQLAGIQAVS